MAIKLTKAQQKQVQELAAAYEKARTELSECLDRIATDWESEFDEKSDRWREGNIGQEAEDRIILIRDWHESICDVYEIEIDKLT